MSTETYWEFAAENPTALVASLRPLLHSFAAIYADPPYYLKGRELYLNHYNDDDHREFARVIQGTRVARWIVTYDNVPEIHQFYAGVNILPFRLRYSAHHASTEGTELLIYPDEIVIPELARERLSGGGFFRGGREETIAAHACIDAN